MEEQHGLLGGKSDVEYGKAFWSSVGRSSLTPMTWIWPPVISAVKWDGDRQINSNDQYTFFREKTLGFSSRNQRVSVHHGRVGGVGGVEELGFSCRSREQRWSPPCLTRKQRGGHTDAQLASSQPSGRCQPHPEWL